MEVYGTEEEVWWREVGKRVGGVIWEVKKWEAVWVGGAYIKMHD